MGESLNARVVAAYRQERSVNRAARICNVDQSRVSRILKAEGVALAPRQAPPKPKRPQRPPKYAAPKETGAPETAVPFEGLTAETCRYPYGKRAPYLFCGAVTRSVTKGGDQVRDTYCAEHAALCRRPWKGGDDGVL